MWSPLRLLSRQGTASPGARGIRIHRFLLVLIARKPLLLLAAAAALFHFANASMLPLLGQKLALAHPGQETVLMFACIIVAQL